MLHKQVFLYFILPFMRCSAADCCFCSGCSCSWLAQPCLLKIHRSLKPLAVMLTVKTTNYPFMSTQADQ
ncbi:MAG TPA: hypothetical protein DF774_14375 [Rheinheimera sp.]|nr:hypothetical protein [Rheinheimera sp.]